MIRFLQILLALVAVRLIWGAVRSLLHRPPPPEVSGDRPRAELRGEVVRCDTCDLHVPEKRIVRRGGRRFCSTDCASAAGKS